MNSSEIRAKARECLTNNWGKCALMSLIYIGIAFAISLLLFGFGGLVVTVISIPLQFGLIISFIRITNKEEIKATDFLESGFKNFGKSWAVVGHILLKVIVPILCSIGIMILTSIIVVSLSGAANISSNPSSAIANLSFGFGLLCIVYIVLYVWLIIVGLKYAIASYIAADREDLSAKDCVEESERIMVGKRGEFFWLILTFIGWYFLSMLTFGIGILWLIPYVETSIVIFYKDKAGISMDTKVTTAESEVISEN